jgi:hypothetical protein
MTLQGNIVPIFSSSLQCAVCERRAASAENAIGAEIGAELVLQGCLDVDVGQNAEALAL